MAARFDPTTNQYIDDVTWQPVPPPPGDADSMNRPPNPAAAMAAPSGAPQAPIAPPPSAPAAPPAQFMPQIGPDITQQSSWQRSTGTTQSTGTSERVSGQVQTEQEREKLDAAKKAIQGEGAIADRKAMIGEMRGRQETIVADMQRVAMEELEARRRLEAIEREKRFEAARAAEDEAARQATSMPTYWEERGTGAKIAAALMVGLGQFGASLSGGQNTAWQIIDGAVKRDIEAKREKGQMLIAKAAKGTEHARYLSEQMDRKLAAEEAAIYKKVAADREAIAARFKGADAGVEADVIRNNAAQKASMLDVENERSLRKTFESGTNTQIGTTEQRSAGGGQTVSNANENKALAAGAGADPKTTVVLPTGERLQAPDEVSARTLRSKLEAAIKVRQLTDYLSTEDQPFAGTEARKKWDAMRQELVVNLAIMNNNEGKPSDSDIRIADDAVPGSWTANRKAGFKTLGDRAAQKLEATGTSIWGPEGGRVMSDALNTYMGQQQGWRDMPDGSQVRQLPNGSVEVRRRQR